jgi:hypothetical protein
VNSKLNHSKFALILAAAFMLGTPRAAFAIPPQSYGPDSQQTVSEFHCRRYPNSERTTVVEIATIPLSAMSVADATSNRGRLRLTRLEWSAGRLPPDTQARINDALKPFAYLHSLDLGCAPDTLVIVGQGAPKGEPNQWLRIDVGLWLDGVKIRGPSKAPIDTSGKTIPPVPK